MSSVCLIQSKEPKFRAKFFGSKESKFQAHKVTKVLVVEDNSHNIGTFVDMLR